MPTGKREEGGTSIVQTGPDDFGQVKRKGPTVNWRTFIIYQIETAAGGLWSSPKPIYVRTRSAPPMIWPVDPTNLQP